ncbi:hypothetical protein [Nguyenibacter sp. L1]|uniref:hypothetical protein n=1 Tax=Nguyenibacter sp. L1 TaxID=3049350 RepID=UPI002B47631F|nr:hypothetical protein [Nguyenibacter sp. L1]WRH87864.1 hypothetical protein QN315_18265 [Nguyenibacter sp. L1]
MTIVIPTGPRRPRRPALLCGLALLPLAILLTACDADNPNAFAPACPLVEVPGPAADLAAYDGETHDVGHLVARASLTRVSGSCRAAGRHTHDIVTDISLGLTVSRGPATGHAVDIPYFIAVVQDGEIKSKKQFVETVTFPPNVTETHIFTHIVPITLPIGHHVTVDSYHIEVGFQLTRAQLDYNRAHLLTPAFHPL